MSADSEMKDVFDSYEYRIREKLEELDWIARRMYSEMCAFRIYQSVSEPYVKQRMAQLINEVVQKGDENHFKHRFP